MGRGSKVFTHSFKCVEAEACVFAIVFATVRAFHEVAAILVVAHCPQFRLATIFLIFNFDLVSYP